MASNSQRTRNYEIAQALRNSPVAEARMVVEMLGIMVEDARTRLVQSTESDMLRVQGEARALEKLYKELTTAPPNQENM